MGGIEDFLQAIPVAAKSPYALIAYSISAILFVASLYQRNQLSGVLKKIETVPENERKVLIESILNKRVPDRLSGEQFLRREKTQYLFLGFIAFLVLFGGLVTIAIVVHPDSPKADDKGQQESTLRKATIKVQLWPRPEIRKRFLKDHDAHLYLKTGNTQIELTTFVPTDDFLAEDIDVDGDLVGKPADAVITPREKYIIQQDRRFLTPLVRFEVFSLGKKPVPLLKTAVNPSGEKVIRTTDLPPAPFFATLLNLDIANSIAPKPTEVVAGKPYLLTIKGVNFTTDWKVSVVDDKGITVNGAWAGNELGTENGKPAEVSVDGTSYVIYTAVPASAAGQKLFWKVWSPRHEEVALGPLTVQPSPSPSGS